MSHLFTWKLTPADQSLPIWKYSKYREPVIVRAEDELQARTIAAEKFGISPPAGAGTAGADNPWHSREAVDCEKVEDPRAVAKPDLPRIIIPLVA
jgi:hypothetical protein